MEQKTNFKKLISLGALTALTGYILSGPVAFILVNIIHPQPAWISAEVFAKNYSTLQDLPFYFGFLLVGGMLMLAAGLYLDYTREDIKIKFHLLVSLCWTIVFSALISFNYICQTTFVHNLALRYNKEYDSSIAAFSMSNPLSFCWANEMWGYGFLGIATLLMSGYYSGKNKTIRFLLITNCFMSLLSVGLTIANINWVMTTGGLTCYFAWNVLMILLMVLIERQARKENIIIAG